MNKQHNVKRILIVGYGSIGRRHLKNLNFNYPSLSIAILRHDRAKKVLIDSNKFDHCFFDLKTAIKFKPDAAIIANPSSFHIEIAIALAKKGVNLLVEKPISSNSKNVKELIEVCDKNQIVLKVAYNLRFLSSLQFFRKLATQEKIGKIFSVHSTVGQYLPDWRPDVDYRQTVSAQSVLGGGALLELSHEIDYIQWIFGRISSVVAIVSKQSNLKVDVEDTASLLMEVSNSRNNSSIVVSLNMDFNRHDKSRLCYAIGEKGTLKWDGVSNLVEFKSANKDKFQVLYSKSTDRNITYEEEIKAFIEQISGKESLLLATGSEGLSVVKVIESAKKSSVDKCFANLN